MPFATKTSPVAEALRTVTTNGAYDASRALSKWLRRGVRLTTGGFESVPISEVASMLGGPEEAVAAIYLPLKGEVTGHLLLTFSEETAFTLIDILMMQEEGTACSFGELEQSCLQETGNIVCSAYANSLSKWLKLQMNPGVPVFRYDMACSIVESLVATFARDSDEILMTTTDFLLDQKRLQWGMLLIPSAESLIAMERQCDSEQVRQKALETIAINGAFNASRAVSKWLKRGVKISTSGFSRVSLNELMSAFPEASPVVALHMPLLGQMHGHTLLCIPEEHALKLVDLLLDQPPGTSKKIGELGQSCLQETGNIIASSFVNSWSTWLDICVEPGVPKFVFDLPQAIADNVVAEQALVADSVFVAQTEFIVDDQWLEWVFMLLPGPSAMRLIESSCE